MSAVVRYRTGAPSIFGCAVVVAALIAPSCGGQESSACPHDEVLCGSLCVSLAEDPQNCGACGDACPTGTVCYAGACATSCGGGTTQCGQSCVDTSLDPHHCGGCDSACASGNACVSGACTSTCANGQTLCTADGGAYCASMSSDNANCGACGHACSAGTTCVAGACINECAPGLTACGVTCVDLTSDLSNCGACGQVCTQCLSGTCVVEIATVPPGDNAAGIAVDASYVYWTDTFGVYRVDKSGNPSTKQEIANSFGSDGIAVGALDRLVWGVAATATTGYVGILDQGVPTYLPTTRVWSVATDSSNAYWIDDDGAVHGLTLGTTTPWTLATGESPEEYSPHNVATDGTNVFWIDHMYGGIRSAPVQPGDGGSATTVFTDLSVPWTLAVDTTWVYYEANGSIWRGPKDGSSVPTVVVVGAGNDFAIDATSIYFIDNGGLERTALGGGTVTKLVDATVFGEGGGGYSWDIAVDSSGVYWTMDNNQTGGSVWKATIQ